MAKKNPNKKPTSKKVKVVDAKKTTKKAVEITPPEKKVVTAPARTSGGKTPVKKALPSKKTTKKVVKKTILPKKKVIKKKRAKLKPKQPIGFKKKRVINKNRGLGLYTRIKSLLWREFKGNYHAGEYSSAVWADNKEAAFVTIVHQVYAECKISGEYCSDEVIIKKYLAIFSKIKRPEPYFPSELYKNTDGKWYYAIKDVNFEAIALISPYLWVVSPMIISEPSAFMIGDYVKSEFNKESERYELTKLSGYYEEFSHWVDWCNKTFQPKDSDEDIPYFIFSKPEWNTKTFRWETEMFSCDKSGNIDSFGYVPEGAKPIKYLPRKTKLEKPETKKEEVSPETKEKPKTTIDKELELQKQKEKTAVAETARMKTQLELLKEYKSLGLSNAEIKKLLRL